MSSIHQRETILVDGNSRPKRFSLSSLGTQEVFPRLTERRSFRFLAIRRLWTSCTRVRRHANNSVMNTSDSQEPERRLTFRCSQWPVFGTANGGHDGHRAMGNRDGRLIHEPSAAKTRPYGFGPSVDWLRASNWLRSACQGCPPRLPSPPSRWVPRNLWMTGNGSGNRTTREVVPHLGQPLEDTRPDRDRPRPQILAYSPVWRCSGC